MRCSKITYGRTMSLGNYENFRLEMEVEIQPGDDTNEALKTITQTVDAKCAEIKTKKQNHQKP